MREHEVPTHVQAEDKVLLWLTFPQVVAVVAVAAIGYGVYSYAPGPSALRIGLAIAVALVGSVAVMGRIGGRSILLVTADLLKYWLGPRQFAGEASELVRSEPLMEADGTPGLVERMREKGKRRFRRICRSRDRRNGDQSGQRRNQEDGTRSRRKFPFAKNQGRDGNRRFSLRGAAALGLAVLVLGASLPQGVLADGPGVQVAESNFPEPVQGRRLYVEGVLVAGDLADVKVRAATGLNVRVRAFGGDGGQILRYATQAAFDEDEVRSFTVPLDGNRRSVTFSWVDTTGQAGAVTLSGGHLPFPLPTIEGELCAATLRSLGWTTNAVTGSISTDCERSVMETLELDMVGGNQEVEVLAVREAEVTAITGRIDVTVGSDGVTVPVVADGGSSFSVPVSLADGWRDVTVEVGLRGTLSVPVPPIVRLSREPERTEAQSHVVPVRRPGISELVYDTVTIFHDDGTATNHRISTRLSIPSATVSTTAIVPVVYPEFVSAAVVEREPYITTWRETLVMESGIWADEPFSALALPEPEPTPEQPTQTRASDGLIQQLFDLFGWEWSW